MDATTEQAVLERFRYDGDELYWAPNVRGRAGKIAGAPDKTGRAVVTLNGERIPADAIAIFMTYGVWPDRPVRHINKAMLDNRIENLRAWSGKHAAVVHHCGSFTHFGFFYDYDLADLVASEAKEKLLSGTLLPN